MSLDLTLRGETASPLTPEQHDANLLAIQGAINGAVSPNVVIADNADGSDQTALVQSKINALPAAGGVVVVTFGTKFSLRDLSFPAGASRTILQYRMDDELEQNGLPGTGKATNEWVTFIANANVQGIVNEQWLAAAFHPGFVVEVRKDIQGQDGSLAGSQTRTNPARASYSIHDERLTVFSAVYHRYPGQSGFNGTALRSYLQHVTLSGIGAGSFAVPPTAGTTVLTGSTSGAKGLVLSVSAGDVVVAWITGSFAIGETVSTGSETSTTAITSQAVAQKSGHDLLTCVENGYWSLGMPAHRAIGPMSIAGALTVTKTRDVGQYIPHTSTVPRIVWLDDPDAPTWTGAEIRRQQATGKMLRTKLGESTGRAHIDAVTAHGNLWTNAAYNTLRSFNIASTEKLATGRFKINFSAAYENNDYSVVFGTQHATDYVYASSRLTDSLTVECVTTGTSTLKDMTGGFFHFAVFGGAPV